MSEKNLNEGDLIDRLKATAKTATNPLKAIRAHCVECCGGSPQTVRDCLSQDCALFDFRLGKNPRRAKLKPRNRDKAVEAMRRWHES